jgi:tRNA (guanine37-N1)-methyltransferase
MPLFAILTLFPEALEPYAKASILGQAQERRLADIRFFDFRDFTRDVHRTVDDRPFGGGPGMVLKPEPIVECVEWLERKHGRFRKLLLTPSGRRFDQQTARELAGEERLLLIAGRYEGFDERIRLVLDLEEISLGDFVLSGGELAALAITEAVARLIPGVLGCERSAAEDSFDADGLDYPAYTRPVVFRGHRVPDVLLSGHHEEIQTWRRRQALERTRSRRPDLLAQPEREPS